MNPAEADLAINYIRECFPDTADWLDKQKSRKPPLLVQERWVRTLLEFPYWDVKIAIDRLFKGTEPFPRQHQNAISSIIGLASARVEPEKRKKKSEQYTRPYKFNGDPTFACKECWDEGVIFCWHPEAMNDATAVLEARRDGTPERAIRTYSCVVACTCKAGDEKSIGVGGTRFDTNKMLRFPVDCNDETERGRLLQFVSTRMF